MKRLEGLDLLLTDWMLGFSILLLIAIRFAPGLVGKQVNARPLDVPTTFKLRASDPYLSRLDLKDAASLISKLCDDRNPLSKYLYGQLSAETQIEMRKYNSAAQPPDQLLQAVIDQLNEILKGPSIFDEKRFAQVSLRDETRRLVAQKPEGETLTRLNRLLLEQGYLGEISESQLEFIAEADRNAAHPTEVCPHDNTRLEGGWCKTCGKRYPIQLVSGWAQNTLFVLLLLFIVKYIHERSVLRFRLYEDERDETTDQTFRGEMERLRNDSNKAALHFTVFVFRIAFLGAFYLFLINLYLKSNGQFQDFKDAGLYAAVLFCAYFGPDFCLFVATKGQGYQELKAWLSWKTVGPFLIIVLVLVLGGPLFFVFFYKQQPDTLWAYLVFLVALLGFLGLWSVRALRRLDPNSVEITALKWFLLDIFNLIGLGAFTLATLMQKFDVTWIAVAVLVVNVFDWLYNRRFYFSSCKFFISARPR
jgi:hypothetical protein